MQFHDGHFDRELADKLEVETGTVFTGIDFAMVEEASISGAVRSRYHNRPLGNVTLLSQSSDGSTLNPFQARTNGNGEYILSHLPPGEYWVQTSLPAHIRRLVNFFYQDKLSVERADKITLEEGNRMQHADFNLPLGATIRGDFRVEDEEYPLKPSGKAVSMKRQGVDLDGFGKKDFKLRSDGSFLIERTPPGRYSLSPVLDDPNLTPPANVQEKVVEVSEGDLIEGVEFPLRIVGSISGTITSSNREFSLQRLTVLMVNLQDNSKNYYELDSEKYTIPAVEPGRYFMVLLTKPDPAPAPFGLPSGQVFDTRVVEVQRGKTTTGANLQVPPEPDRPKLFP
jgi:hypothetical protein